MEDETQGSRSAVPPTHHLPARWHLLAGWVSSDTSSRHRWRADGRRPGTSTSTPVLRAPDRLLTVQHRFRPHAPWSSVPAPGQLGKLPARGVWTIRRRRYHLRPHTDGWSSFAVCRTQNERSREGLRGAILERLVRDRARPVPLKIRPASRSVHRRAGSSQWGSGVTGQRPWPAPLGEGGRGLPRAVGLLLRTLPHFLLCSDPMYRLSDRLSISTGAKPDATSPCPSVAARPPGALLQGGPAQVPGAAQDPGAQGEERRVESRLDQPLEHIGVDSLRPALAEPPTAPG